MKSIIKRAIAVLLILTVALLTACSVTMDAVKAAEIGDSDVDLSSYGEYISNDELGELVSYGGYISKKEYSAMLSDGSVGASYNPSFAFCYDTGGNVITVRRAMIGQYVGESALTITVNGSRAYCIQPGAALNTGSSLTQTTSSGVWATLSANQKEAVNTVLCYGREGNFSNIKGNTSMPIECWRLQGFTDEQFYKAQAMGLSDARLYKMAGNSVTVPVISAIGEKIRAVNEKSPAYGFDLVDGKLVVNQNEAAVIRRIFNMYLQGIGKERIADILNEEGVPKKRDTKRWNQRMISYILINERYMGDRCLLF